MDSGATITGDNNASASYWPLSDTYVEHGGTGDKWGISLDSGIVSHSNFGVVVSVYNSDAANIAYAWVDNIQMRIYYEDMGWSGKFMGFNNPQRIMGKDKSNITKIMGV